MMEDSAFLLRIGYPVACQLHASCCIRVQALAEQPCPWVLPCVVRRLYLPLHTVKG